ncbi:MAG: hypothetical protein HN872_04055 [Gammaproteobacteria bacterium]|nr:hypothetical protein [Pseudomonadales bacterium]MBT7225766.1 hypothetical protein [Gammaproteobacteria bacterium]MDC0413426.1 hypothetical protein [Gammaproteobacteria bacterium]
MSRRFLSRAVAVTLSLAAAPALMAQTSSIPRTEHGVPDFQGTYTFRTLTPLNRPPELADKATLTEEEAAEWAAFENRRQNRDLIIDSVGGAGYPPGVISYNEFWYERGVDTIADRRTSLVYDPPNGRVPPLNAVGKERAAERSERLRLSEGPEARTLNDRCLLNARTGPPMISGSYNNNMQLVQTKDHVMILSEMIHHARIIRFDDEHHTRQLKWEGDSIAHWDGDTLVINTQNYYYPNGWRNTSKAMKVEERFTWLDENTLDYDFTVEDPNTWDVSWSARLPMRRIEDPIYEYACHEGNHGLAGILAGWRRYESMGMNGDGTPKED